VINARSMVMGVTSVIIGHSIASTNHIIIAAIIVGGKVPAPAYYVPATTTYGKAVLINLTCDIPVGIVVFSSEATLSSNILGVTTKCCAGAVAIILTLAIRLLARGAVSLCL